MTPFVTPKFIHIGFNWNGVPKINELLPVFNQALDWIRYAPNCWIVWTTTDTLGWHNRIVPLITQADRVFICELNISNKQGWMDKFAWDWFNKPRNTFPQPIGQ